MNKQQISKQLLIGSIGSIIGLHCYIIAAAISMSPLLSFLLITIWPVTAIIFAHALYKYIAIEKQSISNQLAFLFTVIAFVLVYIMLSIQIGLKTGIIDMMNSATDNEKETLALILSSTNWVHLGIDLAWDMFLGTSMILLSIALKGHSKFKLWWAIPMLVLGLALIAVNLYTFPYPPAEKGIIDIGPIIGVFMIVFAIRTAILGRSLLINVNK